MGHFRGQPMVIYPTFIDLGRAACCLAGAPSREGREVFTAIGTALDSPPKWFVADSAILICGQTRAWPMATSPFSRQLKQEDEMRHVSSQGGSGNPHHRSGPKHKSARLYFGEAPRHLGSSPTSVLAVFSKMLPLPSVAGDSPSLKAAMYSYVWVAQ
ncbi:hypothetical protein MYCTH_91932 [Thermothelomyces thermophilus ATCC 42464]|uniref:Uncharacterized protein n=1 Tax=Thermothelomyces thermophilus (strain ATCC 42464 / BCRC 31852 / DSM 1799) TaxID=573729 RepID=G2Q4M5_THET4|nr:uncharacterized protein MYCTH_91932 [Thermothelomyces thermophilus ATCC 42464]AEO54514.1 hypothetical protein MYCTH_91932 [Thermothelomyces thermophilus ATCC 42464]